jgi:hypothetical protein
VERALNDEISDYFVTSGVIAVEGDPTIHSFEENE